MRIVGRRVKIIGSDDNQRVVGKIGVVVTTTKDRGVILVKIKGWDQGHCGNESDGTSKEYWYFIRRDLRVLPRKKKASR